MMRPKSWLGKPLTESTTNPGNWRWWRGSAMLTLSECDGWWVAQAATDGFIETSRRKRTERAAKAEVEKRLSAIADGVRELSLQLSSPVKPVERRATVAASDSLSSHAKAVVNLFGEYSALLVLDDSERSPGELVASWARCSAAIGELSAALGKSES